MATVQKDRLVFGLFLIGLIAIGELAAHYLALPAWPAFLIMIFFFLAHANKALIQHILIGSAFGILSYPVLLVSVAGLMRLGMGQFGAVLVFVLVFVYAIVALGDLLPRFFNNYAFMSFLFTATYMKVEGAVNPLILVAILLVGGGIFIAGILGIFGLVGRLFAASAAREGA